MFAAARAGLGVCACVCARECTHAWLGARASVCMRAYYACVRESLRECACACRCAWVACMHARALSGVRGYVGAKVLPTYTSFA